MFASNRNFDPTSYAMRQITKRARLNKHLASPTAIAVAPPEVPTAEDISTALGGEALLEYGSEPEFEPESRPKKTNNNQQLYKRTNQREERQDCSLCSGAGPIHQCAECSSYQLCMNCIDFASLVHPSHVFYRAICDTSVSDTSIRATCDTPAPDTSNRATYDTPALDTSITWNHSNSNVLACYSCSRTLLSLLRFTCNKCGIAVCQDCQYYHPHQLEAIAGAADQRVISTVGPSNPGIEPDIDSNEEDSIGGYGAFQGDALQGNVLDDTFQDDPPDEGSDNEGSDNEGSDNEEGDNEEGDNDSLCKSKPPTRLKAQINASKVTIEFPKPFFLAFTKAMCEMTDILFTGKEQEVSIDIPTKVQKRRKLKGRSGDKGGNPKRRPWTLEDKKRLCDLKGQGQPDDAIGKILGRSALAVMQQWYKQKK